jgi:hypothetical protein
MKIDNRVFAIIAAPFCWVLMMRALVWTAGLEWNEIAAGTTVVFSWLPASIVAAVLFGNHINLGHTHIGGRKE